MALNSGKILSGHVQPPWNNFRMPIVDFRSRIEELGSASTICNLNSSINNPPSASRANRLGLDGRLVDQHNRYVVFNSVDPVALHTLQTLRALAIFERLLASRTNQNLQKVFGNHDAGIVRRGLIGPCDGTHKCSGLKSPE